MKRVLKEEPKVVIQAQGSKRVDEVKVKDMDVEQLHNPEELVNSRSINYVTMDLHLQIRIQSGGLGGGRSMR
ncbi:hypothetical protein VNO78_18128 [Psophocarpus tetragonolobus]|uniref:Uncharacterized protein n=1 Tax=Psophocarpus tetragonolobus TaxID=3891 RepID=A0AAN9SK16_PSOTE